ncbi:DUF2089 family protein [Prolixibacteraceae bacterium Z1-6]|uniref:DUF2089 family protein n=1 Tax=Draconibacterium aestuarii TaxID=2998507 RepID=A0A9X3FAC9_9BACT|nr:DUF2089 family protein [Prolixibacteraceae bacterium Z1-6]
MTEQNLPLSCPSCRQALHVSHLHCPKCETKIEGNYVLPAILTLTHEEQQLMLDFVKSNGSPQRLNGIYKMSYPAIRARLDKLIAKVKEL